MLALCKCMFIIILAIQNNDKYCIFISIKHPVLDLNLNAQEEFLEQLCWYQVGETGEHPSSLQQGWDTVDLDWGSNQMVKGALWGTHEPDKTTLYHGGRVGEWWEININFPGGGCRELNNSTVAKHQRLMRSSGNAEGSAEGAGKDGPADSRTSN